MKTAEKRKSELLRESPSGTKGTLSPDQELARRLEELERKADLHEAQLKFLLAYFRKLTTTEDLDVVARPRPNRHMSFLGKPITNKEMDNQRV